MWLQELPRAIKSLDKGKIPEDHIICGIKSLDKGKILEHYIILKKKNQLDHVNC